MVFPLITEIRNRLTKPEYWFHPLQVVHKLKYHLGRYDNCNSVRLTLPWGLKLSVNPHEAIGKSLSTLGVYDLVVSEALWRLTDPDDWCLDVGANIGYTTMLFTARAGSGRKIISFEPHPVVFQQLQKNLEGTFRPRQSTEAPDLILRQDALGNSDGEAELFEQDHFNENQGSASLVWRKSSSANTYRVKVSRLDSLFPRDERFGVVKVDVEGAEFAVFEGMKKTLSQQRIRDLVFEDFAVYPSASARLLSRYGYAIFKLTKGLFGPVIRDPEDSCGLPWEPVNYLATADSVRARTRLRSRGWSCLRRRREKLLTCGS